MASDLTEHWSSVQERLRAADARMAEEMRECWRLWRAIIDSPMQGGSGPPAAPAGPITLAVYHRARSDTARRYLHEPLTQWARDRPYRRALLAVEAHDRSLDELVRSLPGSVRTNGPEIIAALGESAGSSWRRFPARMRRRQREVPIRSIVAGWLTVSARERSEDDGRLLLLLARAIRLLRPPWEIAREVLDGAAMGEEADEGRSRMRWEKQTSTAHALAAEADGALDVWIERREQILESLAGSLLAALGRPPRPGGSEPGDPRGAARAHWAEQGRTVEAEIRLEITLDRTEEQVLVCFEEALAEARSERQALLGEVDGIIDWLRGQIARGSADDPPPVARTELATHTSRRDALEARQRPAAGLLPEKTRTLARLSALPPRRPRWRELTPRRTLLDSYGRTARVLVEQALGDVADDHGAIAREIERAREVVAFGLEIDRGEGGKRGPVVQEALGNALSLMEHARAEAPDPQGSADLCLTRAVASVFAEYRLILGRARLGAVAYLAQEGVRRWAIQTARRLAAAAVRSLPVLRRGLEVAASRFLVFIGWQESSRAGNPEVVTRSLLPREFVVDLSAKEMPAIYRRLFPLTPLQDPRFLVGRSREMEAIIDVRRLWEEGRSVALLIVGERGSGKTSLINCAVREHFADALIVRGAFQGRLTRTADLRSFLARLAGAPDPGSLERFLSERRSVIIVEELDRAFLRQVGGYDAVKELQSLIAATCSTALWILATNHVAFRFLDAATQLGASFSHRINASTASREVLREAILARHYLSGLRLHFASPPARTDIVGRVKDRLTRDAPVEPNFFDALSEASAGVFRAAFDIWLGQIDVVEGGILHMAPITSPDVSRIIKDLDAGDLFTLLAILQHGGLTAREHASIFQLSNTSARSQLDELLAREIIEAEPEGDGFRVRPEAMRVVKEALYQRNLL